MSRPCPRLAARAVILHEGRLLMVNAYADGRSDLWCAPGGGVERGSSLPENLRREVHEETGLNVRVGVPCLVNEYHAPETGFHQVEVFFRAEIIGGHLDPAWQDPEGIVTQRRFVTRAELAGLRHKPDSLGDVAWGEGLSYDPIELLAT
ncbi:ADP-ribose pyrophosphatase YjhB, NUDIX family [Poseidonocella pacifica]|uniref:ADP-ribose pyrophosphatase YjhB, NUDIX family n=1 Tax=Poseidonocella pacifica TaxID=871651 RepID=A0A1I0XD22_9RHOB|nr:NUDIX hydrolase [Poseidonocella pacifica]SFA97863.1 ADP-ribose pyrophosphatase YjhB, NUDIX family [Poseidonocella pacifica]